ncbi:MAG TPA: hypothetical protein VEU96_25260 [Bryobacteraceae bacterium]|nr:hypothetical protein [Bryobacteraceae bacterium]
MTAQAEQPYISVVVAARNDDHGGNMLHRMQAFLNAWIGQAKNYNLPSEIIIVEWNPPEGRPRLMDALEWPDDASPCELRFVSVSPEIHNQFPNAAAIPLHQMIAKNAGIRRARGEFVLATNIDIVMSPELMRFFAGRKLEKGKIYRINRTDVASGIPAGAPVAELVEFCRNHMLRVFTSEGGFELGDDGLPVLETNDIVEPNAGIRFGPGWYPVDRGGAEPFRWIAPEAELTLERPLGAVTSLLMDGETGPSGGNAPITLQVVDPSGAVLTSAALEGRYRLRLHIPDHITKAKIRFRVQGGGVPLERDARILNLRFFGLSWEGCSRRYTSSRGTRFDRAATIRVNSADAQQIQLALTAGSGERLEQIDLDLSDAAGQVLLRSSASIPPNVSRQLLLTIRAGFQLAGQAAGESGEAQPTDSLWRLELLEAKPGEDWETAFAAPSRFAHHMRNPAYLHTNGCGDFTLLSKADWFALRGYAEFPIWPMHIDSLLCYAAHHAGINQVVLEQPMRIFHIEHRSGAGWTPEGEQERAARIEAKRVGVLQQDEVVKWIDRMRRFNAPAIFAQGNWGLGDRDLPETIVGSRKPQDAQALPANS